MHKLAVLAIACCASTVFAQTNTQIYFNVSTGATTRGAIGVNAGQQLTRIDASDYQGIGNPVITGGLVTAYEINGLQYVMQDQNDATPETYSIYFYSESATNPNFPDFVGTDPLGTNSLNGAAGFGPFTQATTGTAGGTISAFIYTLNWTQPPPAGLGAPPVAYPVGRDFFIAISHPPSPGWATTDGGSVHINLGTNPNFPPPNTNTYDLKGPGLIGDGVTNNSYGYAHNTTNGTLASGGPRQYHMVPLVLPTVGVGVATATTNQASYPISNAAPGTASFFSALHPDGSSTPTTAGRVDDSYYVYFGAGAGNLVFLLADFSTAPVTLPLSAFLAGSTGVYCLNSPTVLTFAISAGTGQDSFGLLWSANARNFLLGQSFVLQGVAFDTVATTLKGAPCATIRY
jgi:hypothetical protein